MASGGIGTQAVRERGVGSVLDGFAYETTRVRELGQRIESLANAIVGHEPSQLPSGNDTSKPQPPASLDAQRRQLSDAIDYAINQLNRCAN